MKQTPSHPSSLILVAAGMGTRLGAGMPKALVQVAGKSLAEHAIDRILQVAQINEIIVVTPPDDQRMQSALAGYGSKLRTVPGEQAEQTRCAAAFNWSAMRQPPFLFTMPPEPSRRWNCINVCFKRWKRPRQRP
ncbi:2-C-methyl-D-erythritol 4-phosphate cytidylyltransferase [Glutamicibacter sp. M10]|nr:2-C-methyl-D-erythritol 4-phosphate cytidylyltransferase [Glutamicibacter sp. M10]UXN31970.1 2-C-methyl-D-erythritol 4-phosphate cytidylyltransferase [Glutamicibacter sp. M10]